MVGHWWCCLMWGRAYISATLPRLPLLFLASQPWGLRATCAQFSRNFLKLCWVGAVGRLQLNNQSVVVWNAYSLMKHKIKEETTKLCSHKLSWQSGPVKTMFRRAAGQLLQSVRGDSNISIQNKTNLIVLIPCYPMFGAGDHSDLLAAAKLLLWRKGTGLPAEQQGAAAAAMEFDQAVAVWLGEVTVNIHQQQIKDMSSTSVSRKVSVSRINRQTPPDKSLFLLELTISEIIKVSIES